VVGEHRGVLDATRGHGLVEEADPLDRERLVGRGTVARALHAGVPALLDLLEDADGVALRVHEHGRVLGAGDVPLEAVEDHDLGAELLAGLLDERDDLVDAALGGVRRVAVVGEHDPLHAVRDGLADVVADAVLAVVAEERVDVVVALEPEVAADLGGRAGRSGGGGGSERGDGDAGAGRSPSLEQAPAAHRRAWVVRHPCPPCRCAGAFRSLPNRRDGRWTPDGRRAVRR
jgi:hypothetical protein